MRKLIGTIAIIITLYLGFFGSEKYNIKPFIADWFRSDNAAQVKEKANNITDIFNEKGKDVVEEQTDSIINDLPDNN